MKKFLSIVLMVLLVLSPVMVVEAKTTTTKSTKTTATAKKTAKKTTTKSTKTTKSKSTKKTTTKEASEDKDPINIYVFYSSSCPHCADLHTFLDKLKEDKTYGKMFKVLDYEVTTNAENSDLMDEVVNFYKETNEGVPIYVIGDKYMSGFAEDTYADQIKEAIKTAYEKQPEDKVAKLIESLKNKKDSNILGYIVLAIVAVIIIGVIYSSSKNKYYDDETDSEDETEEVKPVVKETSKKADTKKTSTTSKKKTTKK